MISAAGVFCSNKPADGWTLSSVAAWRITSIPGLLSPSLGQRGILFEKKKTKQKNLTSLSRSEINTHLRALDKQWSCSQFPSVLCTVPTDEFLPPWSPDKSLCKHLWVCTQVGVRAVAKRRTCVKTLIRRNKKLCKSFFFFFSPLPPQPLIALCRNSPKHREQFSNSGRRQSPKSAQKSSSEPPPPLPPPLNPSQRCAHFFFFFTAHLV